MTDFRTEINIINDCGDEILKVERSPLVADCSPDIMVTQTYKIGDLEHRHSIRLNSYAVRRLIAALEFFRDNY